MQVNIALRTSLWWNTSIYSMMIQSLNFYKLGKQLRYLGYCFV